MKIKMLRNALGSNDGFTVHHYEKDGEYDVSDALAHSFVDEGLAEAVTELETPPQAFVAGELYHDADGNLFVGTEAPGVDGVNLLPIEQLGDEERQELIEEGKLKEDGTAPEAKAIEEAPKNKAVTKAPKDKATKPVKNKAA